MRDDFLPSKNKTNTTFQIQLSEEQKQAKEQILNSKIAVITGKAGSSKTMLAAQIAMDLLIRGQIERIYITRSSVSSEDIGYLPGNITEKMEGLVAPVVENMIRLRKDGKSLVNDWLKDGKLVYLPIQYARGITATNSVFIVDESQNISKAQIYLFATRLGKGSLMIFTGDLVQTDLKRPELNGFAALIETAKKVDGMCHVNLTKNYRDPIVVAFMEEYEKHLPDSIKKVAGNVEL